MLGEVSEAGELGAFEVEAPDAVEDGVVPIDGLGADAEGFGAAA
jgi:hypothetical protein